MYVYAFVYVYTHEDIHKHTLTLDGSGASTRMSSRNTPTVPSAPPCDARVWGFGLRGFGVWG